MRERGVGAFEQGRAGAIGDRTRAGRVVAVVGSTTGFGMGGMVTVHTRTSRGEPFVEGATRLVSADGTFTWSRGVAKRKTLWVYVTGGGATSNTLRLTP